MLHLADDREQEECRVLMKFWWQLAMTYQEASEADLDRHVGPAKRDAVQKLIDAIRHSPEAIDTWIADTAQRFPLVQDRGYEVHRSRASPADAAVVADLAMAGLEFLERIDEEVSLPLPAPPPYLSPASCRPEHGRFDSRPEEVIDVDDPQMPAKVNAGWWRMVTEYQVLDERREVLLSVNYGDPGEAEYAWVRVRLAGHWDLAGSGSINLRSGFAGLFTDRFVPEFSMLSTDHQAMLNTTVWGNGTISTIVIRPDRLTDTPIG